MPKTQNVDIARLADEYAMKFIQYFGDDSKPYDALPGLFEEFAMVIMDLRPYEVEVVCRECKRKNKMEVL